MGKQEISCFLTSVSWDDQIRVHLGLLSSGSRTITFYVKKKIVRGEGWPSSYQEEHWPEAKADTELRAME